MRTLPLLFILAAQTAFGQVASPISALNSACEEREPTPSADGKMLYFWRKDCPANTGGIVDPGDVWVASRSGSGWSPPQRMPFPINTYGQEFVWQTSRNGDTLWMCQTSPGVRDHGLSYVVRQGQGWSRVVRLSVRGLELQGGFKDFFIGPGRRLFLVNEGKDGLGGSDLYLSLPLNDTAWGPPIHLGPVINSPGDEDAPFLAPDGQTLYFSSNGHPGKGGHDIFVSKRLDASWRNWSKPEPLGAPVNSPLNDFDFFMAPDGQTAYWAVESGSSALSDLMQMSLPTCETDIYPAKDQTLCAGQYLDLEAGYLPGDYTWQWYKDGQAIAGARSRTLRVDESGAYSVERQAPGCKKRSSDRRIEFVEPPAASVETLSPYLCPDGAITLRASALSTDYAYGWVKNGLPIPAANRSYLVVNTPGRYAVEVSRGQCVVRSNSLEVALLTAPLVAVVTDTLAGSALLLPDWRWTNKLQKDRQKRALLDLALAAEGRSFLVSAVEKKRHFEEEIAIFGQEGLLRARIAGEKSAEKPSSLAATDDEGSLILARPSPILSKYTKNGVLQWRLEESCKSVLGLATDPTGNIFVAGELSDTTILSGRFLSTPRRGGLFLAKYDPEGALIWARALPVDYRDDAHGNLLASDRDGNVYLAAGFELVATLAPVQLKGGLTGISYFVAKFNAQGETLWAKSVQQTGRPRQRMVDLAVNESGNALLLANRQLTVFGETGAPLWQSRLEGPGEAAQHRVAAYRSDFYIAAITPKGELFASVLNRKFNQTVLWRGKGGNPELPVAALIAGSASGIAFSGDAKGHQFPGNQFDLRSNARIFLSKFGLPILLPARQPALLCDGKPVYLITPAQRGIQWYRDGAPIPGASSARYTAQIPGQYSVRVSSGDCNLESNLVTVNACGETAPPVRMPPTPKELPLTTDPAPPPPVQDAPIALNKMPRQIRGRSVKPQKTVVLASREVTISIWDRGAVDLDTISVNLNGHWIVEQYCLQKERFEIQATLDPGDNYLILYAHNLGLVPPNTAALLIYDGRRTYSLELKSTLRNSGALRLRVE